MTLKTRPFDVARYLATDESLALYLTEALETREVPYIAHALGVVARAKGMSAVAKDAGLSRESLYRALSEDGNPELDTLLKVFHALGLKLLAQSAAEKPRRKAGRKRKAA